MTGPVYDTPVIPSPPAIRYWKLTHCGTFFPLKWLCETSVPHTTPLPPTYTTYFSVWSLRN